MIRLDYLSCVLTVLATVLIARSSGKAGSSPVSTAPSSASLASARQFGFVPANLLCIALYASNLINWRPKKRSE